MILRWRAGWSGSCSPPTAKGFPTADVFTREQKDAIRSTIDRPGPLATKPQYDPMSLPNADRTAPSKEWWKAPIAKVASVREPHRSQGDQGQDRRAGGPDDHHPVVSAPQVWQ